MSASTRSRPSLSAALGLGLALTAGVSSGDVRAADAPPAMLLEAPPRELVFQLQVGPDTSAPLDLMLAFRDASVERLGPVRSYTSSPWGRWTKQRWAPLSWRLGEAIRTAADPTTAGADDSLNIVIEEDAPSSAELPVGAAPGFAPFAAERNPMSIDRLWASRFALAAPASFETTGFGLTSDGFNTVFRLPPSKPVVDWRCRRGPVLLSRPGGETWRVELVKCDGSVAHGAIDRVSILARAPGTPSLGELLPDEPDPTSWQASREWAPGVRVVHPRLVWALQQIADAFPRKPIILFSGYRPYAEVHDGTGHRSLHAGGRALDLAVRGVSNEDVFRACTKLRGVACGFYPHNKFVHIDARRIKNTIPNAGEAFFIDASEPGEPAEYVRDYPGLVVDGKLVSDSE
ncbi:MAG: D-Ala-D-Ala carboxypeptidase family metallohydrolase [Polyangiaceae bacterium]